MCLRYGGRNHYKSYCKNKKVFCKHCKSQKHTSCFCVFIPKATSTSQGETSDMANNVLQNKVNELLHQIPPINQRGLESPNSSNMLTPNNNSSTLSSILNSNSSSMHHRIMLGSSSMPLPATSRCPTEPHGQMEDRHGCPQLPRSQGSHNTLHLVDTHAIHDHHQGKPQQVIAQQDLSLAFAINCMVNFHQQHFQASQNQAKTLKSITSMMNFTNNFSTIPIYKAKKN